MTANARAGDDDRSAGRGADVADPLARRANSPLGRILAAGLRNEKAPREVMKESVVVDVMPATMPTRTGAALSRQAGDDRDARGVVGGCGLPRWRDDVSGGITKTLLPSATMPVLLAR